MQHSIVLHGCQLQAGLSHQQAHPAPKIPDHQTKHFQSGVAGITVVHAHCEILPLHMRLCNTGPCPEAETEHYSIT